MNLTKSVVDYNQVRYLLRSISYCHSEPLSTVCVCVGLCVHVYVCVWDCVCFVCVHVYVCGTVCVHVPGYVSLFCLRFYSLYFASSSC